MVYNGDAVEHTHRFPHYPFFFPAPAGTTSARRETCFSVAHEPRESQTDDDQTGT